MAGNYTAIQAQIATIISGVTGIGIVHQSQRLTRDWSSFINQFTKDGVVNGWTISRRQTEEDHLTSKQVEREHVFVIRGMMSVQDDDDNHSEVTFQGLVETICDTFRTDYDLNGSCEYHWPVQVRLVDYRMFGGVLCHYAELELRTRELLSGG